MTFTRYATVLNAINLAVQEVLGEVPPNRRGIEEVIRRALQYGARHEVTQPEITHALTRGIGRVEL